MPKFTYTAMDAGGKEVHGTIEAPTQAQAINQIRAQGFFPTAVSGASGASAPAAKGSKAAASVPGKKKSLGSKELKLPSWLVGRVKPKDLMVMTRQIATLISAGLPLLRGLRVLLKQTKVPALRDALAGMGEAVEGGSTFSEALAQYPKIFNNLYVNMVRAGEAGGVLEVVLARLAEFMEKAERIKNKVKGAMTYPIVVLIATVGIMAFLLTKVIPQFQQIFEELLDGQSLPAITLFVIKASEVVKGNFLMVVAVIVAIVVLIKLWGATKSGRYMLDLIKLKTPVFGTLLQRTAVARLTRTLGTLLASGVPVLQALNIVRDTSDNAVFARAMQNVHDAVKEGENMAGPMEQAKVFPAMVISMVEVGEETGALSDMLMRIADTYDDEVDNAVAGLTAIIEPILIIILAVVVGTIVVAMFMPMISIITNLGQASGA
ncbi:MAG: type II secretion system F family protein [Kiritimatiellia bacterium]|jgi:type IV pilus assembly protein PilC